MLGFVTEDAGRKYNCVGTTDAITAAFLPPRGTECSSEVRGYVGDRTGLQVLCDGDGDPPPRVDYDYEIVNVRRYLSVIDVADWLKFDWRALKAARRFEVEVTFQQGAFHSACTEYFFDPVRGQQEGETTIPSVCGTDDQWSSVTISPRLGHRCRGCGTYRRTRLPSGRTLQPDSADPTEVQAFIDEIVLGSVDAPQRRD